MNFSDALAYNTYVEHSLDGPVLHMPPPANDNHVGSLPRVAGLMGYGGAGKTTVANILRHRHGYSGPHIKAPLLEMAAVLLRGAGMSEAKIGRHLDGDLKREVIPEIGRSGTEIQQFLGTQFGRDFCRPDLWLSMWCVYADRILSTGGRVVQESVRFANEAEAVRSRGGIVIEVRRPGVGPLPGGHVSEILPTSPDAVIENDGSVEDLYSKIGAALLAA